MIQSGDMTPMAERMLLAAYDEDTAQQAPHDADLGA